MANRSFDLLGDLADISPTDGPYRRTMQDNPDFEERTEQTRRARFALPSSFSEWGSSYAAYLLQHVARPYKMLSCTCTCDIPDRQRYILLDYPEGCYFLPEE